MYTIADPSVLTGLSRCISAFARISDTISIDGTLDKLELSCVNASRTVVGRAVFPRDSCFTGLGTERAIQIKSRAADTVFSRVDQSKCVLKFGRAHNGVEVLEVLLESTQAGAVKVCRIPCLVVYEPAPAIDSPTNLSYYFSANLNFFKEILANCMPAAEEAELRFLSHRGFTFRAFRDKMRTDQSKVRAGVDTSVENELRRFGRLQVLSPWAGTMRLKELRTVIQLWEQLFPLNSVDALFKQPGQPIIFETEHTVLKLAFMFRFTTKPHRSALDNTSSVMIRIGDRIEPRISALYGRPQSFMRRAAEPEPEPSQPVDLPAPQPEHPPPAQFVEYAEEIGMTQPASQAVGLFDDDS
ncbi:hypothetical protein B9G98_02970 [Wickerhamiella sorbophila]|uniref:Uncharacterized protein n=1 Tax=Wickerhamiella sorbophila TaxID=45607 RepID=A0A2T0FK40_9ASCO|nr:hypothetical protein B9G98_02970 [Wickerhamiella sorbophila]PRT55350.1 hypothetical protein B9G98_02970 [Wickerhamiella sorbophila]